jgi:hypothetical protein
MAIVVLLATLAAGCGTILYPERRGQPAGRLDFKVVALDAIGMLFFFVPGIVAFAVDFATGAIYLPPEPYVIGAASGRLPPPEEWVKVELPRTGMSQRAIERAIAERTGFAVELEAGEYQACPIDDLTKADEAYARLAARDGRFTHVRFQE